MRRIVLATIEASILVIVVFIKATVITCGLGIVFRKTGARVHFPYHYTSIPLVHYYWSDCTWRLHRTYGSFPVALVYNSEPVIKFSEYSGLAWAIMTSFEGFEGVLYQCGVEKVGTCVISARCGGALPHAGHSSPLVVCIQLHADLSAATCNTTTCIALLRSAPECVTARDPAGNRYAPTAPIYIYARINIPCGYTARLMRLHNPLRQASVY